MYVVFANRSHSLQAPLAAGRLLADDGNTPAFALQAATPDLDEDEIMPRLTDAVSDSTDAVSDSSGDEHTGSSTLGGRPNRIASAVIGEKICCDPVCARKMARMGIPFAFISLLMMVATIPRITHLPDLWCIEYFSGVGAVKNAFNNKGPAAAGHAVSASCRFRFRKLNWCIQRNRQLDLLRIHVFMMNTDS